MKPNAFDWNTQKSFFTLSVTFGPSCEAASFNETVKTTKSIPTGTIFLKTILGVQLSQNATITK